MTTYTIGDVADLSGFSASALRYYEGIGLVAPASRTDAGYRLYDDHTLTRLAFIARAKQLGCTLEEITDLVAIWDGDRCEPVQRRFQDVVDDKIADARRRTAELVAFTARLEGAATRLAGSPADGPCDDGCACAAGPLTAPSSPIACSLDDEAVPQRLAEWRALLDQAGSRLPAADGGLRIEFGDDRCLVELVRLVAAERQCCAFFSFAVTVDSRGIALEVRAPETAGAIVTSLFGPPD